VIFYDRPVTGRYGTAEQLERIGVRKEVAREGILRAIEIEGADLQPCGGTHVRRTSQIGMILVRGCSKIRQDWRVEFVCGRRVERVARHDAGLLRGVAERLSCGTQDVIAAAERMVAERETHFKNARGSLQRLAEAEARLTLREHVASADGLRVVARLFPEEAQAEYLSHFATELAKVEGTVALLARFPCGHLIFAQHPSVGKDMSGLLKRVVQEFGGKGGGTRDFARGKLEDAAKGEKALEYAQALVRRAGAGA
jgi:alanyl-tRNA synthetase